jgi:hypothetical protein
MQEQRYSHAARAKRTGNPISGNLACFSPRSSKIPIMCSALRYPVVCIATLLFFACTNTRRTSVKPISPVLKLEQQNEIVTISWTAEKNVSFWKIYYQYGKNWGDSTLKNESRSFQLPPHDGKNRLKAIAITAVDSYGNESTRRESDPAVLAIIPRSGWEASEARPYKQQGTPVRITVHHEGGRVLTDTADAARRLKNIQSWGMGKYRNWTDIPYHFLVAPDGTVYEGRNLYTVGETNTEYDPSGHLLICFLGNYEQQELNPPLLNILTRLIAYFCKKYNISPETIATHRDYSNQTTCPGKNIYPYFENGYVKKRVIELLQAK